MPIYEHSGNRFSAPRRRVLAGAGWAASTITIATAAPALASSPGACVDDTSARTLSWLAQYTKSSPASGEAYTAGAGATPDVNIDLSVAATGSTVIREANLRGETSELSDDGVLRLTMDSAGEGEGLRLTISFDKPVTDLTFNVYDIDSSTTYTDSIGFSPTPSDISLHVTDASRPLTGDGSLSSPVVATDSDVDQTAGAAYASVRFDGPLQTLELHYENARDTSSFQQMILVSPFSFRAMC